MNIPSKHTNHLIHETSPYLLQHAYQPVDWYPWGEAAFEKARSENKLVLISIGYSACHWCHVMAHESFDDPEIADFMNRHFISIKIDREERPDIDTYYMDAVNLISGRGGWPLNCFALPDGRPIWGGTYFPKPQWKRILEDLSRGRKNDPERFRRAADDIENGIRSYTDIGLSETEQDISKADIEEVINKAVRQFDTQNGGFGEAPKFPMPGSWQALLCGYYHTKADGLLKHIFFTLDRMAAGGLYDPVAGGFARYSVDRIWKVPHFEKMLYDNAQMLSLYSQAYKLSKKPFYKQVVYQTREFLVSELQDPEGGFCAALDADSEGEEGKYYVWREDEIDRLLGENSTVFKAFYSIKPEGNWEAGKNILYAPISQEVFAQNNNIDTEAFQKELDKAHKILAAARKKRIAPGLDNKILTSWNALLLKGFCDAFEAFEEDEFLDLAKSLADFLLQRVQASGELMRIEKAESEHLSGFLDDYAYFTEALILLFSHTGNERYFNAAGQMTKYVLAHFYDEDKGMFYYSHDHGTNVRIRKAELSDNVIPSSNAVMADNLFLLAVFSGNADYQAISESMIKRMFESVSDNFRFHYRWFELACRRVYPFREAVISGPDAMKNAAAIRKHFQPDLFTTVCLKKSELSLFKNRYHADRSVFYLCEQGACRLPAHSLDDFWAVSNRL